MSTPKPFSIMISTIVLPSMRAMGTAPFFVADETVSFEKVEVVIKMPCSYT